MPILPIAAARFEPAKSRARVRMASAETPQCCSASSGVIQSKAAASSAQPAQCLARKALSIKFSTEINRTIAARSQTSPSGITETCSYLRAVSVRRGSTTITRPRLAISSRSSRKRGAINSEPWLTSGFDPKISRWSQSAKSGKTKA